MSQGPSASRSEGEIARKQLFWPNQVATAHPETSGQPRGEPKRPKGAAGPPAIYLLLPGNVANLVENKVADSFAAVA
jgi:hypothetical protein